MIPLVLVAVTQGDAGVLPANPVPPLLVASGGTAVTSGHLGALFINPANATASRGVEASFVSYPRTGLEGFAVVAAGGTRTRVLVGLWSYALTDIFDPELVAQDPSLSGLGLSMGAAGIGTAMRFGRISVGALVAARTQTIIGTQTGAGSFSLGTRLELGPVILGASATDVAWASKDSPAAPDGALQLGGAVSRVMGRVHAQFELNMRVPIETPGAGVVSVAPRVRFGPVELVGGYASDTGWSGGASIRYERLRFEAATNFVSRDRLDRRIGIGFSYF